MSSFCRPSTARTRDVQKLFSTNVGALGRAIMNMEKYTDRLQGLVQSAQSLAMRKGEAVRRCMSSGGAQKGAGVVTPQSLGSHRICA
jgi:hypothetical protein